MHDTKHVSEDLVQQHYKGATPVAAALGEGAIHTKFMAIAGFVVGGIGTLLFHKQITPVIETFNISLENARKSENLLKSAAGGIGHWFMEIPKGIVSWLNKVPSIARWMENSPKAPGVIEGAITASTGAGIVGSFTGGTIGYRHARAGKHQFDDAKSEISTLRTKLIETQSELEDAKTKSAAKKGTLKVADDQTPAITAEPTTEADKAPVSHVAKHAHGKTHAASWADEVTKQQAHQGELAL